MTAYPSWNEASFCKSYKTKKDKHGRIWHQFYDVFICRNIEVKPEAPAGVINV